MEPVSPVSPLSTTFSKHQEHYLPSPPAPVRVPSLAPSSLAPPPVTQVPEWEIPAEPKHLYDDDGERTGPSGAWKEFKATGERWLDRALPSEKKYLGFRRRGLLICIGVGLVLVVALAIGVGIGVGVAGQRMAARWVLLFAINRSWTIGCDHQRWSWHATTTSCWLVIFSAA